jgi:hypothetical protein
VKILLDTLDDRREIWQLLHRLHPARRLEFLQWCCDLAARSGTRAGEPVVSHRMKARLRGAMRDDREDERLTHEVYTDFWCLVHQYEMSEQLASAELVRRVRERKPRLRPFRFAVDSFSAGSGRPGSTRTAGSCGTGRPAWSGPR